MKLAVANKDRAGDLVRELADAAAARSQEEAPEFHPLDYSALLLRSAANDDEFVEKFLKLMWHRAGVTTEDFHIPRKPGFIGGIMGRIKSVLWKVFRYQHDRIAFQQNTVNTQLTAAIEFTHANHIARVKTLERRVAALEASLDRSVPE